MPCLPLMNVKYLCIKPDNASWCLYVHGVQEVPAICLNLGGLSGNKKSSQKKPFWHKMVCRLITNSHVAVRFLCNW